MRRLAIILGTLLLATFVFANAKPHAAVQNSKQLLIITTNSWNSSHGQLQAYGRTNIKAPWVADGTPVSILVGKHGLAWSATTTQPGSGPVKKEGDMRTPAGIFPLGPVFGFGPSYIKKIAMPYKEITKTTVCVNDSQSRFYNHIVDSKKFKNPDWKTADTMRQNPENLWGIVVDYNNHKPKAIANDGSCFFMHIATQGLQTTAGSIALPQTAIENLITWLKPNKRPLLVILPKAEYQKLQAAWNLPKA